jgi:deoxyribodipyrimidine photo-lyase
MWGIHWFRRDLRLTGNALLREHCKKRDGRVLGVFCVDPAILKRPDFSHDRFAFYLETLHDLREELRERGGDLLVLESLEGGPESTFAAWLETLKNSRAPLPSSWSWNRDYEPFAIHRDSRMEQLLHEKHGIEVLTGRDHLMIEPRELQKPAAKGESGFYQVYTPFKKKWLSILASPDQAGEMQTRFKEAQARAPRFEPLPPGVIPAGLRSRDVLQAYRESTGKRTKVKIPEAGSKAASRALTLFLREKVENYPRDRDLPALRGTSGVSIFLKNGSLTVPAILAEMIRHEKIHATGQGSAAAVKYVEELIWREFYYHILAHVPRVERHPFHQKYEKLEWENDPKLFDAWKEGRTGYPIVDAGMRQLNETGWMHNRVRMIVASFLTKDLLIDWRWGERYFMERLLDGDLAPNNGGWQWAASTGCDPQPYFRIFNPALQSQRFDPKGDYARKWIPELGTSHYPEPIVDHAIQKKRALAMYRAAR